MKRTLLASAAFLLAGAASAATPREIHWKTDMSGGALPTAVTTETWVKGEKFRMVMESPVGKQTLIIKDRVVYVNAGVMAMKMSADQQRNAGPRASDYATGLDDLLKNGTKLGQETIDGELCDKWKVVREQDGTKVESTLWISPSLNFPRQVLAKTEQGDVLMKNREIETTVTLADALFEPEPGVKYQDMSELLKGLGDLSGAGSAKPAAPAATPVGPSTSAPRAPKPTAKPGEPLDPKALLAAPTPTKAPARK